MTVINNNFIKAGIAVERSGQNLDITIDQEKALSNGISLFESAGSIESGKFTQKDILNIPVTIASTVVGMLFTIGIIHNMYSPQNDVDELHFNVFLLSPDGRGNNEKQLCYSFDFNRGIFKKIDWDNFDLSNFLLIAPNFTYSAWCINKFGEEAAISKSN